MRFSPLDIPGFIEAVLKERLVRDACFLGLAESVGGFDLRQMTLRDWLIIRMSPQMSKLLDKDRSADADDVTTFLWFMSTSYRMDGMGRRKFTRSCKPLFRSPEILEDVLLAIREYIAETMQDRSGGQATAGFVPSYYSPACFWCGFMGKHYHQPFGATMNMPLKQLFQFAKEAADTPGGNRAALGNPSDAISAAWCLQQSRN